MGTYEPNFELARAPVVLGEQCCYWFRLLHHSPHAQHSWFFASCFPASWLLAAAAGLSEVTLLVYQK